MARKKKGEDGRIGTGDGDEAGDAGVTVLAPPAVLEDDEAAVLDAFSLDTAAEVMSAEDLEREEKESAPCWTDPGWDEYAMGFFAPHEKRDGKPLVHGLRRVVKLLVGPILESVPDVVQAPVYGKDGVMTVPAVVKHRVRVMANGPAVGGFGNHCEMVYGACADVWRVGDGPTDGNTDKLFARFGSATAETRAEARCLRKLLGIRTAAAEEMAELKSQEAKEAFITSTQLAFIDNIGRRMDLNIWKFLNSGKSGQKYSKPSEIPCETAESMCEAVAALQRKLPLKDSMKGYDENWKNMGEKS